MNSPERLGRRRIDVREEAPQRVVRGARCSDRRTDPRSAIRSDSPIRAPLVGSRFPPEKLVDESTPSAHPARLVQGFYPAIPQAAGATSAGLQAWLPSGSPPPTSWPFASPARPVARLGLDGRTPVGRPDRRGDVSGSSGSPPYLGGRAKRRAESGHRPRSPIQPWSLRIAARPWMVLTELRPDVVLDHQALLPAAGESHGPLPPDV